LWDKIQDVNFNVKNHTMAHVKNFDVFSSVYNDENPPQFFIRNSQENPIEIHTKFTLEFTYPTTSFHMKFTSGFTEKSLSKFTLPDLSIHLEL
jgi:hypothetical protein